MCVLQKFGKVKGHQLPTITHVTSLAACQCVLAAASTGVNRHRFSDDQSILHQFADLLACGTNNAVKIAGPDHTKLQTKKSQMQSKQLTRVCVGDLVGLIWVQPHLLLATAQDAGRQALLEPEHAG